jgi:hypothetical protein
MLFGSPCFTIEIILELDVKNQNPDSLGVLCEELMCRFKIVQSGTEIVLIYTPGTITCDQMMTLISWTLYLTLI